MKDSGKALSEQGGYLYGWNRDMMNNMICSKHTNIPVN